VLADCRVQSNTANLAGGILNRGVLDMDHCEITGNMALDLGFTNADAGGLASASSSSGGGPSTMAMITNSTIADNSPAAGAGGIELSNGGGAVLENVTVSGNAPDQIHVYSEDVTLQHVTVVGAGGVGLAAGSFDSTPILSIWNSVIDAPTGCTFASTSPTLDFHTNATSDGTCGFSDVLPDPMLGPLADNGGPTRTRLPLSGSGLIDTGALADCLPSDQRGVARPIGSDCDLGAVEAPEATETASAMAALGALSALARRRHGLGERS